MSTTRYETEETSNLKQEIADYLGMEHGGYRDGSELDTIGAAEHIVSAIVEPRTREAGEAEQRVRDLHSPVPVEVLAEIDCANEDCDHDDECPSETVQMCAECDRIAEAINPYYSENGIGRTLYPCPTIQTLEGNPND